MIVLRREWESDFYPSVLLSVKDYRVWTAVILLEDYLNNHDCGTVGITAFAPVSLCVYAFMRLCMMFTCRSSVVGR